MQDIKYYKEIVELICETCKMSKKLCNWLQCETYNCMFVYQVTNLQKKKEI